MDDKDWLTRQFDESRAHLRAVAHRMLGSASEADDALQEAWLKLSRADSQEVNNVAGWLTTVVARVCLDMLRSRRARREEPVAPAVDPPTTSTPETEVGLADAIGPALLVVLDMLAPQERVAFVLHDMFDLSFEEIAPIVDRTPAATRQLASRARRRVRGAADGPAARVAPRRELIGAFLAASRDGDFERLVAVLSPDIVLRADDLAVRRAAANQRHMAPRLAPEVRGAPLVADAFNNRTRGVTPALIDGEPGAAWVMAGQVLSAWLFTIDRGGSQIAAIDVIMDPAHLAELDVQAEPAPQTP
jgi:RNA polymerase sigma-70 factor (ECF subfamily)